MNFSFVIICFKFYDDKKVKLKLFYLKGMVFSFVTNWKPTKFELSQSSLRTKQLCTIGQIDKMDVEESISNLIDAMREAIR